MRNQEVNFDLGSSERNFESGGGGIGTFLLPSEPR